MKKIGMLIFAALLLLSGVARAFAAAEAFVYDPKGKRDPFLPPSETGKPVADVEVTGKLAELRGIEVQGIIWDEKNPLAMIQDEIIAEGQDFKGAKVLKIELHSVTFEFKGEKVRIEVKEEDLAAPQEKPKKEIKQKKDKGK